MNIPINQLLMQKGSDVVTISPNASVYDAIKLMDERNIGALIALNANGKIAGIFVERDYFRKVVLAEKSPKEVPVKSAMTKKVICVSPEITVDECMAQMTSHCIRHVPVVDNDGQLLGIISMGDLVKFSALEKDAMIRNLVKYIDGSL